MKRCTYRLEVAYDGSGFESFAYVPGARSVWSTVRSALIRVVPGFSKLAAAGRTDRGVNASRQVFSFISTQPVAEDLVLQAIDDEAPGLLCASSVQRVSNSFHALFSAKARHYVYFHPDVEVDVDRLRRMLHELVGQRCFGAYARDTPRDKNTVKRLLSAEVRRERFEDTLMIRFDFTGESFLRRQVRVMVATALREAVSNDDPLALVRLAELSDRRLTAFPAPPEGLWLYRVSYDAPDGKSK